MAMRPPRARPKMAAATDAPYQWIIEGDIKGCFDHIDHHFADAARSRTHRLT